MNHPPALPRSTITPPESFTSSPLTPPPSDEKPATAIPHIIQKINDLKSGHYFSREPWLAFQLDASQYKDLQGLVEDDGFVQDKVRYDFFPLAKRFVLRMPSRIHETFAARVVTGIVHQLSLIASGQGPSAEFAQNIEHIASTTLHFDDPDYGRHDPDASFQHAQAQYPGVIIEVSYTQKRKDLPHLADDYILGSGGDVRVVIGLDVEYLGKTAVLSIWRPRRSINKDGKQELRAEQTVINQVFRDDNSNPNPDPQKGLNLQLEDFATEVLVETYGSLADQIFLPSDDLCVYLNKAEERDSMVKQWRGIRTPRTPGERKRRREITPPEELAPDRERIFQDEEKKEIERSARDDSSYKASSTPEVDS